MIHTLLKGLGLATADAGPGLRKLGARDGAAAIRLMTQPEVLRELASLPRGADAAWMGRYLAQAAKLEDPMGVWGWFGVDGSLQAVVSLLPSRRGAPVLGYMVEPAHWGQGLATQATAALLDRAGRIIPGERVQASVEPDAAASVRVLEKLGFAAVGDRPYLGPSRTGAAVGPHFERTLSGRCPILEALVAAQPSRGPASGVRPG